MTQYVNEKVQKMEQPKIAWAMLFMVCILAAVYALFVSRAILNVVEAKAVTSEISLITTKVGQLESEYLAAKSSVDLDYAHSLGFAESKSDTIYIAKSGSASLSLNK